MLVRFLFLLHNFIGMDNKRFGLWHWLGVVFFGFALGSVFFIYSKYQKIFGPSISLEYYSDDYLLIPSNSELSDVYRIIDSTGIVPNISLFKWVSKRKKLENHIHPGRYLLIDGMSINSLINMIRSGKQEAVKLTFNNIRTKEQLAGRIAEQIELDSISVLSIFRNQKLASSVKSDTLNYYARFIPNTYLVYWSISPAQLAERIEYEYQSFWNAERKALAALLGYRLDEILVLASIVEEETAKNDEKPRIAGVYLNRLKRGMPLQADPTIKFALQDFEKKRITKADLKTESAYNTYLNAGLPPGPIRIPAISSIDAVLNFENHKYLYFCAREDFSGYHNFASTHLQHSINARKYHQALNRKKIFK